MLAIKSSIYFCGINSAAKKDIGAITGFQFGELPFKYLGVPISAGKLKASDCDALVDKMTLRIKTWSYMNLSFAGRAQLINSILMSISVYWAHIFIFPKPVLKKITSVCRSFLWHGSYEDPRPEAVAWDRLCWPKTHGGLGVQKSPNLEPSSCGETGLCCSSKAR